MSKLIKTWGVKLLAVTAALFIPVVLLAQTEPGTGGFDMDALFTAIASVLVIFAMQGLKWLSVKFQGLSDVTKALVAGGMSLLAGLVQSLSGVALSGDVFSWSAATVQALLVWGLSMGWHAVGKKTIEQATS